MQSIPKPEVLDGDRVLDDERDEFRVDHRQRAALLDTALHDTAAYANQLWNDLAAFRDYLTKALPHDGDAPPAAEGAQTRTPAPVDDAWQRWIDAYAAVTSVLCGPHGDSGFGVSEAHEIARMHGVDPQPQQ